MSEQERLNPQVAEIDVGIRNLRKVKVYPLSMADEMKMTKMISDSIKERFGGEVEAENITMIEMVDFILDMLKENLPKILTLSTDEDGDDLMGELSNLQAAEIAEKIYETNFEQVTKNFKSLFGKITSLFLSGRPSPPSVSDTPDTGSTTSTENPGEKEAPPSDS